MALRRDNTMTYPDPNRVRANRHTVSLDKYENDLITALANYKGDEIAVLLRNLAVAEARQFLDSMHDDSLQRRVA